MAPIRRRLLQLGITTHALVSRLPGGRLLNVHAPIVLLTTVGRTSGRPRTAPLDSVRDGEASAIIGSYGGSATHPAWYRTLQACPRARITDRGLTLAVSTEIADGAAYERRWGLLVAANPAYARYRGRATRLRPIVRLHPR